MEAIDGKAAVLTDKDGKTTNCTTVFIGTGGHREAPVFQIYGFQGGNKSKPVTQMIYVECPSVQVSLESVSKLYISYSYVTGSV